MKYAWITAQGSHAVHTMCKTLDVSTSGYYAWRNRKPSSRMLDNARLLQRIRQLHSVAREAYGTERMWQSLRQNGESCGRHRVQCLRRMPSLGPMKVTDTAPLMAWGRKTLHTPPSTT